MMTEYSFYNDGNNLLLEGDFGYLTYNDKIYFSSQIVFYSSSMHTFGNKRLPLEMQIIHKDDVGNNVIVVILFKYTKEDYSVILGKLGFDEQGLLTQSPFAKSAIVEDINLSKYVSDGKDFFSYEGKEPSPPCESDTTYLILADVLKVSAKQLDNFPQIVRNRNRIVQDKASRKIYTNFKIDDIEKKKKEANEKMKELEKEKKAFEKAEKLEEKVEEKEDKKEDNKDEKKDDKKDEKKDDKKDDKKEDKKDEKKDDKKDEKKDDKKEDKKDEKKDDKKEDKKEDKKSEKSDNNKNDDKKNSNEIEKNNKPQSCNEGIPFDDVLDKVKAYAEFTHFNDPKYFDGGDQSNIIKDLPDTETKETSNDLEDQYSEWMKLYDESKEKEMKPKSFLQMKIIEKNLKNANYRPYLEKTKVSFTSFLQTSNEKNCNETNDIPFMIPPNYIFMGNGPTFDEDAFEQELVQKMNKLTELVKTEDCVNRQLTDKVEKLNELVNNSTGACNQPVIVEIVQKCAKSEEAVAKVEDIVQDEIVLPEQVESEVEPEIDLPVKEEDESQFSQPFSEEVEKVEDIIVTPEVIIPLHVKKEEKPYVPAVNIHILKLNYQNYKNLKANLDVNDQDLAEKSETLNIEIDEEVEPIEEFEPIEVFEPIEEFEHIEQPIDEIEEDVYTPNPLRDYLNLRNEINSINEIEIIPEEVNYENFFNEETETPTLLNIDNNHIQIESSTDDKINENIGIFEKLRGFADVLDKSFEVKKDELVKQEFLPQIQAFTIQPSIEVKTAANLFKPNYNANVYNLLQSTIEELHKDYNELDQINVNAEVIKLCDENGKIKLTVKNLGQTINEAYKIINDELTNDQKVDKLANTITDLVLQQEDLEAVDNVSGKDIESIIEIADIKLDKPEDAKELIFSVLKNYPISLLKLKPVEAEPEVDPNDIFFDQAPKKAVYGPNTQIEDIPGQGRQAVSKDGTIEKIDISNTAAWPNACK
jgi:hypothetical protein